MLLLLLVILLASLLLNGFVFLLVARKIGRSQEPAPVIWITFAFLWSLGLGFWVLGTVIAPEAALAVVLLAQVGLTFLALRRFLRVTAGRALATMAVIASVGGVLSGLVSTVVRAEIMQAFRVPTGSMEPTFQVGDHFLVDKRAPIRRGDCVAFPYPPQPSQDYFKRVVGLPGDTVLYRDKQLIVNGEVVEEPYVVHRDENQIRADRDRVGPVVVPEGHVYVLGDNRDRTVDSRRFGPIALESIHGRVWLIYAPPSRWKLFSAKD